MVDLQAQRARLGAGLDEAIARVLEHGAFVMGPEVGRLEEALASRSGVRHGVACSSGTDALVLALMALGVGRGDAVLVPAFTFVASAEAVLLCGATPVFVDVDESTACIDPGSVVRALAGLDGLRPKAVVAVDLYGHPAAYRPLAEVIASSGATLISDAAQSFGGSVDGAPVGSLAAITAVSFFPSKPLGCYGDGGAVLTDDAALADALRSLRAHGEGSHRYEHVRIGMNGRLDTIQAAVLLVKLTIFDDELQRREKVAERYAEGLRDVVEIPLVRPGARSTWAQYTIRTEDRAALAASLADAEVATAVHYPCPLHRQPAYCEYPTDPAGLPVSERLSERVLSLPMHPYLDEGTQDRVISAVRAAV